MFNEYPYRNITDVNLDFILKHIKNLETNLQDFIKLNTITYADPIDWNISKQYKANTVVVNDFTGVAYLSTKPVPASVDVTNTDYWTPIFTLDFVNMNKNITLRNDGNNNNATFPSVIGDWLIVGGQLYKVIQTISLHTAYVVGYNIQIYSVELFVRDYLNQVLTLIGDLQELTTSDRTSIVNAINSVLSNLNTKIGDLQELDTEDKTSVVNAINSIVDVINNNFTYVTPKMFGAKGDGITDDTTALQNAINYSVANKCAVLIPTGTYIHTGIITKDATLVGAGGWLKVKDNVCVDNTATYFLINGIGGNSHLYNLNIDGNMDNNTQFLNADAVTMGDDNSEIVNCHIINAPDSGISFSQCYYGRCVGNTIEGYRDCGIYANNNDQTTKDCMFTVSGNVINDKGLSVGSGIAFKRICQKFICEGNIINTYNGGITLETASTPTDFSTDCIIANNIIKGFAGFGIMLRGSYNCVVNGNYLYTEAIPGYAILCDSAWDCVVSNNIIHYNIDNINALTKGIGVINRSGINPTKNVNITGNSIKTTYNTLTNNIRPIIVTGSSSVNVEQINISNNIINGGNGCITLQYVTGAKITDNIITNVSDNIVVSGCTNVYIQGNDKDVTGTSYYISYVGNGFNVYQKISSGAPIITDLPEGSIMLSGHPTTDPNRAWLYKNASWVALF